MSHPVYIVHLRQPKRSDPNERRSDPFFEFGSFGCTGCHSGNLLHPKRAAKLAGARLAFAQGGNLGFRLVYMTPPITVRIWTNQLEATWKPAEMPFRYPDAPILVSNDHNTDFPLLERLVASANRETIQGCFSSCFRSRATPLDEPTSEELVNVYDNLREKCGRMSIAAGYEDALPYAPAIVDRNRRNTYRSRIRELKTMNNIGRSRKAPSCSRKF